MKETVLFALFLIAFAISSFDWRTIAVVASAAFLLGAACLWLVFR